MCIFCKIISGEIGDYKIYEDAETLSILDIGNDFVGHTLVIPKQHYANILDCPADILAAVMKTVKKVSKHFIDNCGYDGVNVFCNNGECANQSVMHLHFHIVPQKKNAQQRIFIKTENNKRDLKAEQKLLQMN